MFNKRLIQEVPAARKVMARQVLFQVLGMLSSVACTLVICHFTIMVLSGKMISGYGFQITAILVHAFLLLVFCGLKTWFSKLASQCAVKSSEIVKTQLRQEVFSKMAQIGPGYKSQWSTAELSQLMTEGIQQLETYFAQYIPQFFYALIAPMILFVITAFWDWKAALVLLICVPLIPGSIIMVQKLAKKLLSKYWDNYTGLSDSFLENLQGLTTLKVYKADEKRHQKMNQEAEQFRKITMRVLIMQLNSISVMDAVAFGGSALGMVVALYSYENGSLNLFYMLAFILLSAEFFLPMRLLGSYFHISMNGSAAADKIFKILDTPVEDGTRTIPSAVPSIIADAVSFTYENSLQEGQGRGIKEVTFTLPSTGFYGIVGESGSGKSTLAKMLQGQLRQYQGSLAINGVEVNQISNASLCQFMTIADFESMIFSGTVRDNLLMANPNASEQEMIQALEKAYLWKTLEHKNGLDTRIEEKASNLSGGQRQRLALARAILKNSPVLLFDEATCSMDAVSEDGVMDSLKELSNEKLILVISHRLANVQKADRILILENGESRGWDTHEGLLKNSPAYQKLWEAQQKLEAYVQKEEEEEA